MFNVDVVLEANDKIRLGLGTQGCHSHRPRFQPSLSKVEAYIGEIDDSIADTHLQHGLKRHRFA